MKFSLLAVLIPEFVLITLGRSLQQLDDKSRLVFYPLCIARQSMAEKPLDVGLKLLPSPIRCLLIHGNYLPFSKRFSEIPDRERWQSFSIREWNKYRLFHDQIVL
jgi:hypothetical protein